MSQVKSLGLKKRLALNLFNRFTKNLTKEHQLNYIMWECTLRCNLQCRHCGSDCHTSSLRSDMPASDFLRAIDEIIPIVTPNTTTIVFTGGEPLLRKDLEQVGVELYHRGFPWGIVTNGMLLNDARLTSLLNSGLRSVTVSLDGMAASHGWLRGNPESYARTVNAISLLGKSPGLVFDVVTCVNGKNIQELETIKDLLVSLNVSRWRLFTIFPRGRAKDSADLSITGPQFKLLLDFIATTRKDGQINASYGCEGFLGTYEGEVRDTFYFCRSGVGIASILADGSITGCTSLRNDFTQGNIYHDNFAQVWENKFQVMRDRSWTKVGICANCSSFKWCNGNGLHLHDNNHGEPMMCHLHKLIEK